MLSYKRHGGKVLYLLTKHVASNSKNSQYLLCKFKKGKKTLNTNVYLYQKKIKRNTARNRSEEYKQCHIYQLTISKPVRSGLKSLMLESLTMDSILLLSHLNVFALMTFA